MTEPTGTRNHAHHIMCGYDRICPACGKTWFAAVKWDESPLCVREEWSDGCNWYPTDTARHSPAFRCYEGEECAMCLRLGINAGKRREPIVATEWE